MSKLIKTTLFALVVAAVLLAFRGPDQQQQQQPKQTPLNRATVRDQVPTSDTLGREVDLDSAQACIDRYEGLMSRYGFTSKEGQRLRLKVRKSKMITTGEVFSGSRMIEWLRTTEELYRSHKLAMHVKVQLGVYTDEYLRTYHPEDAKLRERLKERIGIFMIPIDSVSKLSIRKDDQLPPYDKSSRHGPSAEFSTARDAGQASNFWGGGGKGYDLGGVQP